MTVALFCVVSFLLLAKTVSTKLYDTSTNQWLKFESAPDAAHPAINHMTEISSTSTIFIGLVSYRDKRCGHTLKNIFSNAKYPDRLSIGRL